MIRSNNGMHQQSLMYKILKFKEESTKTTMLDLESILNLDQKLIMMVTNMKDGAQSLMNGYLNSHLKLPSSIHFQSLWQEVRKSISHMKNNLLMINKTQLSRKEKNLSLQWSDQRRIDQPFSFIYSTFLVDRVDLMKS